MAKPPVKTKPMSGADVVMRMLFLEAMVTKLVSLQPAAGISEIVEAGKDAAKALGHSDVTVSADDYADQLLSMMRDSRSGEAVTKG